MPGKRNLTSNPGMILKRIGNRRTSRKYRNKELIFAQGDAADAMFYIEAGNVKLTVSIQARQEGCHRYFPARRLLRGRLFRSVVLCGCPPQPRCSYPPLCEWKRRSSFASSMKTLCLQGCLSRICFLVLSRIEGDLLDQLLNSSERRLARTLLLLAGLGVRSRPYSANLKVSQGTLAEMVGTTRSRVSFFMNRFRKMGLIDYNGSLRVHKTLFTFLLNK